MQLKIIKKQEKPLLSRTEVVAEVSYEATTPGRAETKKAIAKELKASEGAVVIRSIEPVFGEKNANVTAEVYKDEKAAQKIASDVYLRRDSGKAKEKKAPAEAAPAEEAPKKKEKSK